MGSHSKLERNPKKGVEAWRTPLCRGTEGVSDISDEQALL
jgi:hypothetical protein